MLAERTLKLINEIFTALDRRMYKSPLNDESFAAIFELIDEIRKSELCVDNRYLFTAASDVLNMMIDKSPTAVAKESFPTLLTDFKSEIESVANGEEVYSLQNSDQGIIVAGLCTNITQILIYNMGIDTSEFEEELVEMLLQIADDPKTNYFEEIMETVGMIFCRSSSFDSDTIDAFLPYIELGLTSGVSQSIKTSCRVALALSLILLDR